MRMRWVAVAGSAVIVVALYIFYTYPRPVAISLHGVQIKLGNSVQAVTPVTLTLQGTVDRYLFRPETFFGTVDIKGATFPDRANGQPETIQFNTHFGGFIFYGPESDPFHMYGAIYPNRSFTEFVVQEWHHSEWSSANGFLIVAPAETRSEAIRLANRLMKGFLLPGHLLGSATLRRFIRGSSEKLL
ncbi:MAG: hypothetical protein C7B46_08255 [Sulfobacillus benefaciens]|uniref:Uncharacterized protein n=1 Tax=Sulfobacillus benefaciens TaxID=453960 RepID=A0A2T2XH70_9FIRM|nr:MAG: hypothetical protein C7B46_08255 [Sulfobacillus benefaciens]